VKRHLGEHHQLILKIGNQIVARVGGDMRGGIIPRPKQAIVVDDRGQFRPSDPAVMGQPFPPALLGGPIFRPGMDHLNPIGGGDSQAGRRRQKILGPVGMPGQQAQQAGAMWQAGEPTVVGVVDPAVKGARATALARKEQRQRDNFAGRELRLGCLGTVAITGSTRSNKAMIKSSGDLRTSTRK
jgi:hypothetical protein